MAPPAPTTPSRGVGTPAKNAAVAAAAAAAPFTYSTEEALKDTLMGVLRFFVVAVGRASSPHGVPLFAHSASGTPLLPPPSRA